MKMSITRFHFWRNRIGWEVILFPVFSNRNYEFGTGPVLKWSAMPKTNNCLR